jgi:hypothetical protein
VKNCGYPFHLQIATKDFLNELVRRFPERPPPRPSTAQRRILGMIEEWRATIVVSARDPKDFAHIRDMHRLLRMKGFLISLEAAYNRVYISSGDARCTSRVGSVGRIYHAFFVTNSSALNLQRN